MVKKMNTEEQQIDIRNYLQIMMKRRWTIISVFTIIFVSVFIYTLTATPVYQSTIRLVIEKENPNVVSIQEVMSVDASTTDYYITQYKIIESRTIAREVIKRLNLQDSEEFNPKPQKTFLSNIKQSIKDIKDSIQNTVLSIFRTGNEDNQVEIEDSDAQLVSAFLGRINVTPIRNSRLVDLHFMARNPKLAAKAVNTLADVYIEKKLETKLKAVKNAVLWLHERVDEEREKVEHAERKLLEYKEKKGIFTDFSSDVEKITAQKLARLNSQVIDAEAHRVEAETRYKQALALKKNPDMLDSIPEVLSNDLIREIKQMEVNLYKRISELSKKYGKNHPKMIAVQSEIDSLNNRKHKEIQRVINSLRNEYQVALAKEKTLLQALSKQKKESMDLNQKSIQYGVLQREAESARHMYELLIKRFKETSLTEDMKTGNVRIVDPAEVPKYPIRPRKKLNIFLGTILGLFMGIAVAFTFEFLDNTLKNPEDIRNYLNVPYLGPVPTFDLEREDIDNPELITQYSPKSTASESYRGIRTSLLFSSADKPPKIILISSAGPSEGKTLTSTNLAITMAQAGSRVVIVDCDMRKPKVHKMFGIGRDKGMSSVLVSNDLEEVLQDVIIHSDIPNLDVIPCGPIPPNPSEIIGSQKMSRIMEILQEQYDRIIVDSPPITAVTDSTVLAKFVDGVMLVVHAGVTPRQVVKTGLEQIQGVDANILGAVLNDVDTGKESYYYYQYYYYYYGEDGEKKHRNRRKKRSSKRYG
jgi:capsular exopolysaccharide synthesis family protein